MAAAQAEILRLARTIAPEAEALSIPTRELYYCYVAVDTDDEKKRIKEDAPLLRQMSDAAAEAGRRPDYLAVESQETVDRRWNGNWHYVWR